MGSHQFHSVIVTNDWEQSTDSFYRLQINFVISVLRTYCQCLSILGVCSSGRVGNTALSNKMSPSVIWQELWLDCKPIPSPIPSFSLGGEPRGERSPGRAAIARLLHQTCSHRGEQGLLRASHQANDLTWRATRCTWAMAYVSLSFNKTFMWHLLKPAERGFSGVIPSIPAMEELVFPCC